jgi:hypothetical protein
VRAGPLSRCRTLHIRLADHAPSDTNGVPPALPKLVVGMKFEADQGDIGPLTTHYPSLVPLDIHTPQEENPLELLPNEGRSKSGSVICITHHHFVAARFR